MFTIAAFSAPDLTGVAAVNVTSDTSSNAKIMAFNEARRQITTDVLSKYSDSEKFNELIKNTDDSTIGNLVSSTSIDSERLSTNTYSANIKVTLDMEASKKFLDENDVQNWLVSEDTLNVDMAVVTINVTDGLRDWMALNHAFQSAKINLEVKKILGDEIIINVPMKSRSDLISAIRELGWKYSDNNGSLSIWK